jgi:hypothetical protein
MPAIRHWRFWSLAIAPLLGGCVVPQTQFNEAQSENRVLTEQNRAQTAEINYLREHAQSLEDRLVQTEGQLALYKEQNGQDHRLLARYEEEHDALYQQYQALARNPDRPSDEHLRKKR